MFLIVSNQATYLLNIKRHRKRQLKLNYIVTHLRWSYSGKCFVNSPLRILSYAMNVFRKVPSGTLPEDLAVGHIFTNSYHRMSQAAE